MNYMHSKPRHTARQLNS